MLFNPPPDILILPLNTSNPLSRSLRSILDTHHTYIRSLCFFLSLFINCRLPLPPWRILTYRSDRIRLWVIECCRRNRVLVWPGLADTSVAGIEVFGCRRMECGWGDCCVGLWSICLDTHCSKWFYSFYLFKRMFDSVTVISAALCRTVRHLTLDLRRNCFPTIKILPRTNRIPHPRLRTCTP